MLQQLQRGGFPTNDPNHVDAPMDKQPTVGYDTDMSPLVANNPNFDPFMPPDVGSETVDSGMWHHPGMLPQQEPGMEMMVKALQGSDNANQDAGWDAPARDNNKKIGKDGLPVLEPLLRQNEQFLGDGSPLPRNDVLSINPFIDGSAILKMAPLNTDEELYKMSPRQLRERGF